MKKRYWAVGVYTEYHIVTKKPDVSDWASISGPYKTLAEAKAKARAWIASDRGQLAWQLDKINSMKAGDL